MGRARTRRRLPESRPAAVDDSKTDDYHSVNSELYSDCIEGELQKQIELQIEKITSFADSHTIEVTSPLKQHGSSRTRGCNVSRRVDISNVPAVTKGIEEIMPCSDPKRPRLSPLAARAALAASLQGFASVNLVQSALVTKLSQAGGPLKNISVNFTLASSVFQPTEITPTETKKMNHRKLTTKVLPIENHKSGFVIQHIDKGLTDISRNLASQAAGSVEENVSTHFVKTGDLKLVNPGHGNQVHRKGIPALHVRRSPRHSVADNDQVLCHTVLENQRNAKLGKFTKEESPPRSLAEGSLQNEGLKQAVAGPKLPKNSKSVSTGTLHVRRSPRHSIVDNDQVYTASKDQRNDELEKIRQEEIPQEETPPGSVSSGNTCEVDTTYKSLCYNKTPTEQSVPDRHVRRSPRLNVNGKEENLHLKASFKDVERVTSETNAVWQRTTRFSVSNSRKK